MSSDSPAAVVLDTSADDFVLPFSVEGLDVRGRIVRLGPAIDAILARHSYPDAVSTLLAEATTLAVMLGASLKIEGRFILQTQSDGPVNLLVVDFELPNRIRACATFDRERVEAFAADQAPVGALLGTGHMAMTIDPGTHASRYQGVVPLDGGSLEDAARLYFRQSEQIPTAVRLAAAHAYRSDRGGDRTFHWRAGGILVQHLPEAGPGRMPDLDPGDVPEGVELPDFDEVDEWTEARMILETVEDHELIDPSISAGNLLIRLYHERGVRVFDPTELIERCRCSQDRITDMLRGFSDEERADMVKDDEIVVTCEFCSTEYHVDPAALETSETS
ncbi:Hsp33 family molecular chaperone [Microbaculum marinum]|uniref:Hsp33 family molecular chaperone n=1 Tax=Microbaculum marinum TaxID=1764581 RepID=A0AAW9RPR8_9HYPH